MFSMVGLALHAVKCQAISSDRYVTTNPIAKYNRPIMGSISIAINQGTRLIKQHKHGLLFIIPEPEHVAVLLSCAGNFCQLLTSLAMSKFLPIRTAKVYPSFHV
jgi:hypothetical protein